MIMNNDCFFCDPIGAEIVFPGLAMTLQWGLHLIAKSIELSAILAL